MAAGGDQGLAPSGGRGAGSRLQGRVAVVTGGGSVRGMGAAIAHAFAREGATVTVLDLDGGGAESVAEAIRDAGGAGYAFEVDVAQAGEVRACVDEVARRFGGVDIAANAAGRNAVQRVEDITEEDWRKMHAVNLDGVWNVCQAVLPTMKARGRGKIVNIAAGAGIIASPGFPHYVSAKHAVVGLTRALAVDLGPYDINVNCICPGAVPGTGMGTAMITPEIAKREAERVPLGRLGTPGDIAQAALFLCSDEANWITGVALPVDGGLTCCMASGR